MTLPVTNVQVDLDDPVSTWPFEALVTVLETGYVVDWQPILAAIREDPWGPVARRVERYIDQRRSHPSTEFPAGDFDRDQALVRVLDLVIARARATIEARERMHVCERVRACIHASGLSARQFAERIGTSPSRLTTYVRGTVTPSAAMLVRMERVAESCRVGPRDSRTGTPRSTVAPESGQAGVPKPTRRDADGPIST